MKLLPFRLVSLLVMGLFLLNSSAFAGSDKPISSNLIADSPNQSPVVARVYFTDEIDLKKLAGWLDIWDINHTDDYLVAMLSPLDQQSLLQGGYRFEIDAQKTAELSLSNTYLPGQISGIPGYPCYRTVEETYASLEQLAIDNPNLVTVIDIGDSWEKSMPAGLSGYDIYSAVITNQVIPGPKPKLFLMAAIHAREYATAELATRFAEHLVSNYGIDPDITWLLDNYELHLVPHTNPDGRKIAETGNEWRKNTDSDDGCFFSSFRGVDLNRNSSFKWAYDNSGSSPSACAETYRGPSAASEPETQAVQDYVASIFPDQRGSNDDDPAPDDAMGTFITLHSFGDWVLFPWGWNEGPSPNDISLETLGRKFGFFNHYLVCQSGESGCIYPTNGSSDDWAYGELGLAAYTFEVGTEFFESCSFFESTIVHDNLPALLFAFKATRLPYQDPAGPETLELTLDNNSVPIGSPVTLTATADDTRYDSNGWGNEPTQSISAARYSLDAPAWKSGETFPLQAVDGNFNAPVESLQAIIDTTGWNPGRHLVFVESQDANGVWGVPSATFLVIEGNTYLPDLQPIESRVDGVQGEKLIHTFTLTNLGSTADTFNIQLSGNTWDTNLSDNLIGPLEPGESQDFSASVTVPLDAAPGTSDQATLTATSQGENTKTATALAISLVKPNFAFEIDPLVAEKSGRVGELITYSIALTNIGALEDTYSYSLGEHAWEMSVSLPTTPLPADESFQVTVTVAIPLDSEAGNTDHVKITFTSQGDPSQSTQVTLVTNVVLPLYLPIISQ